MKVCCRCGANEHTAILQLHHWAPQAIFDDADSWPKSWLCLKCHGRWHAAMIKSTPTRSRKVATIDALIQEKGQLRVALEDAIVQMKQDDTALHRQSTVVRVDAERVLSRLQHQDVDATEVS